MNLSIELPYCYDTYNKKEDILSNEKIFDYLILIIKINKEIGNYMDILDRIHLFDTIININNNEINLYKLDKIIKKIKKNKSKKNYSIIFEKTMISYYLIINYKIKYNILIKSQL